MEESFRDVFIEWQIGEYVRCQDDEEKECRCDEICDAFFLPEMFSLRRDAEEDECYSEEGKAFNAREGEESRCSECKPEVKCSFGSQEEGKL